ncbi:DUF4019 domain-containing protein [Caulobacter sp. KR2-114]|uniref:DUF4019 domain-containing protein n=1 Tax=Caulobacter sp. KR2-114 TaxID=3400912 RepID=UPI003C0C1F1D
MARLSRPATLAAILSLALAAAGATSAQPRQVNLTTDSAPGWLPSEDLEAQARQAAADYLADEDAGRYPQAYARQSEAHRQRLSLDDYQRIAQGMAGQTGAVIERHVTTITWTKDPAHAPAPGVYVAMDLEGRYAKADRYCGYLVLYQAPEGGAFTVMREESNILANDTAQSLGPAAADAAWARESASCPNYRAPGAGQAATTATASPPIPEAGHDTIGYPTVEAALKALHARPGVVFSSQKGWTIATEEAAHTFWSFPPPGHPAYPAAVKRWLEQKDGAMVLRMAVHCEAAKAPCDALVHAFELMNHQAVTGTGP